jgi:hypothetical protein
MRDPFDDDSWLMNQREKFPGYSDKELLKKASKAYSNLNQALVFILLIGLVVLLLTIALGSAMEATAKLAGEYRTDRTMSYMALCHETGNGDYVDWYDYDAAPGIRTVVCTDGRVNVPKGK